MKKIQEKLSSLLVKLKIPDYPFVVVLSVLVGIGGGFGAIIFRKLIAYFGHLFFDQGQTLLRVDAHHFLLPLIPAAGGLLVGLLIYHFAREVKGDGVPEVMEACVRRGGFIRPRVATAKVLASSICIGSGGSVGREGPIVQIGSALGSTLGQLFKLKEERTKLLVACGAAAGIAATFNAPIAGVFFALEIILGDFRVRTFAPVVLSSVTASITGRAFLGNYPAFIVPKYNLINGWEIPLYLLLGLGAGLIALLFILSLYRSEDLFRKIRIPEYLKPVLGGLLIGIIAIFFPHILGVGYGKSPLIFGQSFAPIDGALNELLGFKLLIILVLLKILATSLTLGSGGSGGIFSPSLLLGALFGGAFGSLAHRFFPTITATSGAYALVGMGAVVAAAAHAPITAILIIFELTDNYLIILPLMAACTVSTLLVRYLKRDSIYTEKLTRKGISIRLGREVSIMERIKVKDVMDLEVVTVREDMTLNELIKFIPTTPYSDFPVVNTKGELVGAISYQDIRMALAPKERKEMTVGDITSRRILTTTPDETLNDIISKFSRHSLEHLCVVDKRNKKRLLGVVNHHDIMHIYNRELLKPH
jgi:CIC family chloride channel protein